MTAPRLAFNIVFSKYLQHHNTSGKNQYRDT